MNEINTPRTLSCFPCCPLSNPGEQSTSQNWGNQVQAAANTAVPPIVAAEGPVSTQPGERFVTAVDAITNVPAAGTSAKAVKFHDDIIGSRTVGNVNILAPVGIQPDSFKKDFSQRCQDSFLDLAGSCASAAKQRFEKNYGRDNLRDFNIYAVVNFIIIEFIKRHGVEFPEAVREYDKIKKTFGNILKTDPLNRKSFFSNMRDDKSLAKLENLSLAMKNCIGLLFDKNDFGPGLFMLNDLVLDFILYYHFPNDVYKFSQISNRKEVLKFLISPYLESLNRGRDFRINTQGKINNKSYIENIAQDLEYIRNTTAEHVLAKVSTGDNLAKASFEDMLAIGRTVNEPSFVA